MFCLMFVARLPVAELKPSELAGHRRCASMMLSLFLSSAFPALLAGPKQLVGDHERRCVSVVDVVVVA